MTDALTVSKLEKTYRSRKEVVHALKDITFSVKQGEIFGLLGPNGAGKSTTINIITGLLEADSGEVLYFGKALDEEMHEQMNAASAFRIVNQWLTVEQNLRIYATMYNVKDKEERITELLGIFGMKELRKRKVSDLSSGQRARVSLCKALINSPKLLFLDEATAGLDPDIAHEVRKAIMKIDTTIIFTSHQMHEVEELCDRIAFIKDGRVAAIGTPEELKRLTRNSRLIVRFSESPARADTLLKKMKARTSRDGSVSFEINKPGDVDKVVHALTKAGFRFTDVHTEKPTLDEVFVTLARRKA